LPLALIGTQEVGLSYIKVGDPYYKVFSLSENSLKNMFTVLFVVCRNIHTH